MIGTAAYWEEEGAHFSDYFVKMHAVIVAGGDAEACAHVAIGIARMHSRQRKVVVVDLAGELAPIEALVKSDAALGLSDYILYGASVAKTVRKHEMNTNLFVLTSGAEPVPLTDVLADDRWQGLRRTLREEGALMLLVASLNSPGLPALIASTDGVVGVGGLARAKIGDRHMLAHIEPPSRTVQAPDAIVTEGNTGPRFGRSSQMTPTLGGENVERRAQPRKSVPPSLLASGPAWLTTWHLVGGAVLVTLIIVGVAYVLIPKKQTPPSDALAANAAPAAQADAAPPPPPPPPTIDTTAAGDTLPVLPVSNPDDSADASAWSIQLLEANTADGAKGEIDRLPKSIPVRTLAPVQLSTDAGTWYRVMLGAFSDRTGADSLYNALQSQDILQPGAQVIEAPYALLLKDKVTPREMPKLLKFYAQKKIAVYALKQRDGRTTLYAGAYASPKDAGLLALTLQQAGVTPVLVFRTGRQ